MHADAFRQITPTVVCPQTLKGQRDAVDAWPDPPHPAYSDLLGQSQEEEARSSGYYATPVIPGSETPYPP